MTPTDLETFCRQNFNAVGDTFFSQTELFNHMYWGQKQLATAAKCIRKVYTTSTAISTREYAFPTNTFSIRRVEYDGQKLAKVTFKEDDTLTITNSTTTASGTPAYYSEWARSFFLRPIPAAVGELKLFTFDLPQAVSTTSSLDVPEEYHMDLSLFVLKMMAFKDRNTELVAAYEVDWKAAKLAAIRNERLKLRGDAFYGVNDEDTMQQTVIGQL